MTLPGPLMTTFALAQEIFFTAAVTVRAFIAFFRTPAARTVIAARGMVPD